MVYLPKLNLIEPWASSGPSPVATRTWEGSRLPEAQAEPVEASIPNKSKCNRIASPSAPGKETLKVLGIKKSWEPFILILGTELTSPSLNFTVSYGSE